MVILGKISFLHKSVIFMDSKIFSKKKTKPKTEHLDTTSVFGPRVRVLFWIVSKRVSDIHIKILLLEVRVSSPDSSENSLQVLKKLLP